MEEPLKVYACDIGSVRSGAFAWAGCDASGDRVIGGASIDDFVAAIVETVERCQCSIGVGFEAPLYLPVPPLSSDLSRGRSGEGSRSMFAPAGAAVTALGAHEAAWILRALYGRVGGMLTYTLDPMDYAEAGNSPRLLVWEAFVSQGAHGSSHLQDAATAATAFADIDWAVPRPNPLSAQQPLSLVHAAALWSGWADDLLRLHSECAVVRPDSPYLGAIEDWRG